MSKEYIILDSNNNWLSTGTNKREAIKEYKEFVKMGENNEEYEGMEIGDSVYLYEAKEIISDKTY